MKRVDRFFDALVGDAAGFGGEGFAELGCFVEVCGGGELVLACQLFRVVGDTVEEELVVLDDPDAFDLHLLDRFALNVGNAFLGAGGGCGAKLHDGADGAERVGFLADGGAELHHGLVVIAGRIVVEHGVGGGSEGFDGVAIVFEGAVIVGQAGENAHHIAIDHGGRIVLRDGTNRRRGVGADAGEGLPLFGGGRFGFEGDVFLGELVQVAGAAVVAEAFPVLEDIVAGGVGECCKVGEAFQPAIEVGQHRLDLRLLCHELGHDGFVKRGGRAPWQWALRGGIPVGEGLLKG